MRVLVTGVKGQLGHDVVNEMEKRGLTPVGVDLAEMDITDKEACDRVITEANVEAVIHCAAYTAVDAAEDNVDVCMKVNAGGTRNIAEVCKKLGIKMMYISTDYVFGASGEQPLGIYEAKNPLNTYGETKLSGENSTRILCPRSFIVRTSWVFGINGSNFVKTMLRLGREKEEISVVSDQIGSPTYTADLAPLLCDMAMTERFGTYHATNEGYCSWYEFAREIMRLGHLPAKIHPVATADYPSPAARPLNSRLSKESLDEAGFPRLPHWKDALQRYLSELAIAEEEGVLKAF